MVSDSEIAERLKEILNTADLTTTTTAIIRRRLQDELHINLSDKKAFIREQVDLDLLHQQQQQEHSNNEVNEEEDNNNEVRKEEEEAERSSEQEEDDRGEDGDDEEEEDEDNDKIRKKKGGNQQDLFNILGALYSSVLFIGVSNSSSVQPVVDVERTVFYRERTAAMYSEFPYAFGQVAIEFPYVLMQSIIYALLVYSMVAFEWTAIKFFWFLFFMYFTFLYFTFFGMVTVAMTPNFSVAAIVSSTFYSTWNLFCGFLIPRPKIPVWWRWYCWLTPISWTLYGLVGSQLGDVDTEFETADGKLAVSKFIETYFGIRHDFLGIAALVIVCLPVGFASLFGWAIKYLNFQKR